MSLGFPRNAGNFLTSWGTACLQIYIPTPFPAFPYKRVITYGVAHALTSQELLSCMGLCLMMMLLLHVRQTLWQSLSATLDNRFPTCKHLRGQIGQDYGNLTDTGLGAHPDSVYAAQRLLSEAFSTSPQKSAQLRVQCEQLYTQPLRLLWFRQRSVNKVSFIKSERHANTSLAITPTVNAVT